MHMLHRVRFFFHDLRNVYRALRRGDPPKGVFHDFFYATIDDISMTWVREARLDNEEQEHE